MMITYGEVEKLRSIRTAGQSVQSLYVDVPPDSAGLGQLPVRTDGSIGWADLPGLPVLLCRGST
jgi:hypothetical protein